MPGNRVVKKNILQPGTRADVVDDQWGPCRMIEFIGNDTYMWQVSGQHPSQ